MTAKEREVTVENIYVGASVTESDTIAEGAVVDCSEPHNIMVKYTNGGSGLYCLVKECNNNDCGKLFFKSQSL